MNKQFAIFLISFLCISICSNVCAQADSLMVPTPTYQRILGDADFSIGKIRGCVLGDSITVVARTEKSILEAQGNDFLFYRVLSDSIHSAEISYVFNGKGLLVSIGIQFFESYTRESTNQLSDQFLTMLNTQFGISKGIEMDFLQWIGENGVHIEYKKTALESSIVHSQIEIY